MSDYFDRLAGKNLGNVPLAQPVLTSSFAPGPLLDSASPMETFEPLELERSPEPDIPPPGIRTVHPLESADLAATPPPTTGRTTPPQNPPAQLGQMQFARPEQAAQQPIPPRLVSGPEIRARILTEELPPDTLQPQAAPSLENQFPRSAPVRSESAPVPDQPPAPAQPAQSAPFHLELVDPRARPRQPEPQAQPALVQSENARRIAGALEPVQPVIQIAPLTTAAPETAPARQPQESALPQTVVKITIGRIDVRASAPPPAAPPAASPNPRLAPSVTLEQYLKARSEERS